MSLRFKLKYFLYLLVVLYMIFLAVSMMQIDGLMTYSQENIDFVRDRTRDIRSRLNEQPNLVPGLLSTPGLLYEGLEAEFSRQEGIRQKILMDIQQHYPGDLKTVDALMEAFRQYRREVRKLASRLEDNAHFDLAVQSYQQELMPYFRQIMSIINEMDINIEDVSSKIEARIKFRLHLLLVLSVLFGSLLLLFFIMADMKETAKSREVEYRDKLFNQLSQNVDEIFIIAASPEEFVYVSSNIRKLLGLDAEAVLNNPGLFYSAIPDPEMAAVLRAALESPQESVSLPETTISFPGLQRYFRLRLYPIGIVSGRKERFIISLSDQTATIQNQEALSLALENAHAASEAKSSFLSHMSHEIRTPMNAIIGMTSIALSRINDITRVKDCLGKISDSSKHLLGLINDVLDMSKIESGKFSINNAPFNLHHTLDHIRNVGQVQAAAKRIVFTINADNVEDDALIGDSLRLNQILLNLLSNAWKFTPPGGRTSLTVTQRSSVNGAPHFLFIVEDTGIGMSQEFLKRLYEPFEQASAAVATKYGGTGLGMPITLNIITLMGGSINVESEEGKGSRFTVELPFERDPAGVAEESSLAAMKALVVDDDPGACEHISLLLDKLGLKSAAAQDGHTALEILKKAREEGEPFDICLIDWKMPDLDGPQTVELIRESLGDEIAIIITSAYDYSVIRDDAEALGINEFLAKPIFTTTLQNALMGALHKRQDHACIQESAENKKYDFGGKRILLAEDNEFNAEIAREFLEMVNVEVETAPNGKIAVEKFKNSPSGFYDLILMDVQMPEMDGYEAARAIRASGHSGSKTVPILAMTANVFAEDISKAFAAGMNEHIAKPIDTGELYAKLDIFLHK